MCKQLELKVRFCTSTALKVKEDCTEFWNEENIQQCLRTSLSDLRKIQISFYETDLTRILNGLRSPKPRKTINNITATRCHAPPQSSRIAAYFFTFTKKSRLQFAKVASPLNPAVLDLQNLKNLASNDEPRASTRHQNVRWSPASFTRSHAPISASHASPRFLTRPHAPLQLYDVMMTSLPTFSLTRFLGPDPNLWPGPNRLQTKKKTEKKKKKKLWPSRTLTLTKKSKF